MNEHDAIDKPAFTLAEAVLLQVLLRFCVRGGASARECLLALGWVLLLGVLACPFATGAQLLIFDYGRITGMVYTLIIWGAILYYLLIKLVLVSIRRCRDAGVSVWWAIGFLVPCMLHPFLWPGFLIAYLVLTFLPAKEVGKPESEELVRTRISESQ